MYNLDQNSVNGIEMGSVEISIPTKQEHCLISQREMILTL